MDEQSRDPLRGQLPDMTKARLLGQGRTAEVFVYESKYVIKLFRPSFPKQAIDHEYRVCREIASAIDIPAAHAQFAVDGREAILFDRVDGESGMKHLLRHPWKVKSLAEQFASIHAQVHAVPIAGELPPLKSILIRNMQMHEMLPNAMRDRIIRFLDNLPEGQALCHGDFHPDNLLFQGNRPFVLDWMTAARGNPLADVARTSILLRWAHPGPGIPKSFAALLNSMRGNFYRHYLAHYLALTGADAREIVQWELPVMAARLMEWIPPAEKELLVRKINELLDSGAVPA
ncbi:MAG TPA: aminoglycoside phosphotransferase family protein [Bacteroidota bacterium]|nr:aminoglycoside phosphotransferase family protein [Bacteroidota bacterium]